MSRAMKLHQQSHQVGVPKESLIPVLLRYIVLDGAQAWIISLNRSLQCLTGL